MNSCSSFTNRFSDYIDQRMSAQERAEFLLHIRQCSACKDDLATFERAHAALETLATPLTSRPVLSAVRARIRQEDERRKGNLWRWAPLPALAAAALAVVVVTVNRPYTAQTTVHPGSGIVASATPGARVERGKSSGSPTSMPANAASEVGQGTASSAAEGAPVRVASESQSSAGHLRLAAPVYRVRSAHSAPSNLRVAQVALSSHTMPEGAAREERAKAAARIKYLVVAYQPSQDYSATMQDPVSGRELGEMAVSRTLADDGTVKHADIILRFPPAGSAVEDNGTKDDNTNIRSDIRSSFDDMVGRV